MFTHYRSLAIFLSFQDRGEADRLFTVFTENFGKIDVLGRGIRKIHSKLRAGTGLFVLAEIEFIQGRVYKTLTDAVLVEKFKNIQRSPERTKVAGAITLALQELTPDLEPDLNLWNLLRESLRGLNDFSDFLLVEDYFLWNLFRILGYSPDLFHCVRCQKRLLPETLFFSSPEGGVLCWRCLRSEKEKEKGLLLEIFSDTIKILRLFENESVEILPRLRIEKSVVDNLKTITQNHLEYLKETLFSSLKTD